MRKILRLQGLHKDIKIVNLNEYSIKYIINQNSINDVYLR